MGLVFLRYSPSGPPTGVGGTQGRLEGGCPTRGAGVQIGLLMGNKTICKEKPMFSEKKNDIPL